jgi:hypothetical protein
MLRNQEKNMLKHHMLLSLNWLHVYLSKNLRSLALLPRRNLFMLEQISKI